MKLHLSSDLAFYTIQGEGPSLGTPAVFLRVAHCTLDCVYCDSASVWKKSTTVEHKDTFGLLQVCQGIEALNHGAHLVLTGGSPLLQQRGLAEFLDYALHREQKQKYDWHVEVETEGVLMPKELVGHVAQWNVSPKLANSGMPLERRYHPDVLQWHNLVNSCFKFPVATAEDMKEVDSIVEANKLFRNKVWLMPIADTKAKLDALSPIVVEWAKQRFFHFSTRLHLSIWDTCCGV